MRTGCNTTEIVLIVILEQMIMVIQNKHSKIEYSNVIEIMAIKNPQTGILKRLDVIQPEN